MAAARIPRNERVADLLHSAAIHLLRSVRKTDTESGLSAPRLSVLSVLVFAGPQTLGQLAEIEQVRPPTMTRFVAGLVKDGFVGRSVDRVDRRVVHVRATKKGEAAMWAARRRRVRDLAGRLEALSGKELAELESAAAAMERLSTS